MTDEELLIMYNKYKRKRKLILLFVITTILLVLIFFFFNSSKEKEPLKETDTEPPKIVLSEDYIEVEEGEEIDYDAYIKSATDNSEGNLIEKVTYNEIDTSKAGEYIITYEVSDSSNNKTKEELKVKVIRKELEEDKIEESPIVEMPPSNNSSTDNSTSQHQVSEPTSPPSNNSSSHSSPNEKIIKYFLFSDGYTMQNVASACAEELKSIGRAGMCSPIQDENGIYLGMKLETN